MRREREREGGETFPWLKIHEAGNNGGRYSNCELEIYDERDISENRRGGRVI